MSTLLSPTQALAAIRRSLDGREAVALVTVVAADGAHAGLLGAHLVAWQEEARTPVTDRDLGAVTDALVAGARDALQARRHRTLHVATEAGAITAFVEVQVQPPHLVIAGAGHIALPLAAMARLCDFEVSVLDDRSLYANAERFPTADRVVVAPFVEGLRQLRRGQPVFDPHTYVVLVTRGHQHDVACLLEILEDPVAYIGMIGSRRRIRAVFDLLVAEQGISAARLERIYAPVGLDIGAQTPAEIALCITAEIVNVMRGGQGGSLRGPRPRARR